MNHWLQQNGRAAALVSACLLGCATACQAPNAADDARRQALERARLRRAAGPTTQPSYVREARGPRSAAASSSAPQVDAPGPLMGLAYQGRTGEAEYAPRLADGRAAPAGSPAGAASAVLLDEVLESVEGYFPLLIAAYEERNKADGKVLKAEGGFDTKFSGTANFEEKGFYENDWLRSKLEQPTPLWGVTPFVGYKWGQGDFPTWFKDRQTNRGGELSAGIAVPVLRDGWIDRRRADLSQSELDRQAAEPKILKERIKFLQKASEIYWKWVGAGVQARIARSLLQIAEERDAALARRVELGDLAPVERTDNERVIVARRGKLIAAERKFQQAALELQLYYRDANGDPVLLDETRLPAGFPLPGRPSRAGLSARIDEALLHRPEVRELALAARKLEVERLLAVNQVSPRLDVLLEGSQDYGMPTEAGDKTLYEFAARLVFETPLQFRKERGALRIVEAELSQLRRAGRFARDRVVVDVQDAVSALEAAYEQWRQAQQGVELARRVERAEVQAFDLGQSDVLKVNLRELATADAAAAEVEAITDYFIAVAAYRAALALDAPPIRMDDG